MLALTPKITFAQAPTDADAWINEIHYDNTSTDVNEGVEIVIEDVSTFPLSEWSVELYNGNGGVSYGNVAFTTPDIQSTSNGFTIAWKNESGIQNGGSDGDGLALVYDDGTTVTVVQFLSYEGVFTATDGPANGVTSIDIGVEETGSTLTTESLQLSGTGDKFNDFTWQAPAASTNGNVNNSQTLGTPKAEPANHATNITTTVNSFSQITLSWDDATGTPAPDAYLIKVSDTDLASISDPTDTNPESDDTDLSDGNGALNISQGTQVASFSTLDPNTQYFFKIYPYTNSGSDINYKTGSVPADNATTDEFSSSLIISQYVDTGSGSTPKGIELWNVSGSTIDFSVTELIVNLFANDNMSATTEATVNTGTLAAGAVMVIGGSDLKTFMDNNQPSILFIEDSFSFNGNDALEILLDGSRQDLFGTIGGTDDFLGNGVSAADQNIGLKPEITNGAENGFSDPSTRFTTIDDDIIDDTDLAGFGVAPDRSLILTGTQGFRLLSIPTSSTSFANLVDPLWTQGMTGADDTDTNSPANVWTWDNNSTTNENTNWNAVGSLNDTHAVGTGFLMFVFEDDDGNTAGIQNTFPKSLSLSGSENTGPVEPNINDNDGGFTLLGNPFASTIDFDLFTKTDINAAYVWDPNDGASGNWFNRTTGMSPAGDLTDGLIAPFQGFLVENIGTLTGTPSVTIEEADKSGSTNFRGKVVADDPQVLRLELQGQGNDINLTNSAWLSFSEQGSANGRVRGDALELASLSSEFAQLATSKAGTEKLLDINHLPDAYSEAIELPLSVSTTQSGQFTLEATDFNIPAGIELIFNDLQTGESLPITEAFSYTLNLEAPEQQQGKQSPKEKLSAPELLAQTASETESAAYSITIEPNVITSVDEEGLGLPEKVELDQNFPNPFNPTTTIRFALPESQQVSLEVYDLLGRRVAQLLRNEVRSAGSHSVNFDAASLSSGVYIYQLRAEDGATITKKLTLIK